MKKYTIRRLVLTATGHQRVSLVVRAKSRPEAVAKAAPVFKAIAIGMQED